MSLLNTASSWISSEKRNKRQSTMKKPSLSQENESVNKQETLMMEGFNTNIPESIQSTQKQQEQRNTRVTQLIEKMANCEDENNDGNYLENFNPLPVPNINVKKDMPSIKQNHLDYNPNVHEQFSNYSNSYNGEISYKQSPSKHKNVNATMDGFNSNNPNNHKLLEKINYMIHLLEQQQHEKTENITEEFILYSFLGIFIIYVVDGFSRGGKYIR
jgi:hypothetical protein